MKFKMQNTVSLCPKQRPERSQSLIFIFLHGMLPSENTIMSQAEFWNREFARAFNQSIIIDMVSEGEVWTVKLQKNCAICSPPRTSEKTVLFQDYCLTVPGNLLAMVPLCWFLHCSKGQKWFLISCCHTCSVQLFQPSGRKFFQYSSWQVSEMEYSQNYCTKRASVLIWKH